MARLCLVAALLAVGVLGETGARAQPALPAVGEKKVTWTASFEPATASPGQVVTLKVKAQIAPGWHIYGPEQKNLGPIPTSFELTLPEGWTQEGGWTLSVEPTKAIDPGFQFEVAYLNGAVDFTTRIRVAPSALPGRMEVQGRARCQSCNDTMCLPPTWTPWSAILEVVGSASEGVTTPSSTARAAAVALPGSTAQEPAKTAPGGVSAESTESAARQGLDDLREKGLGAFLLFAIGAGLVSLLTPCVFPMIPITVSFFTKRAERSPRRGLTLALVYAGGIVVTFSLLGLVLSAVLGAVFGISGAGAANWIAASPWVNLGLAALFVIFALSLFGLFDIQLPGGLANRLQQAGGQRSGVVGALVMAFVFTITSFTCTVQFVGPLLVQAARGDWFWPGIGMVVYSAAFAAPFFLLALFPQGLSRLPRSGPWLHATKVLMGFLELAAAFKFLSNSDVVWRWGFFNRELVLAAWAVICFFTGLYLLGKLRLAGEPAEAKPIGTIRLLLSMAFVSFGLYLASGLTGTRLQGLIETYLPPAIPAQQGEMLVASADPFEQRPPSTVSGLTWIRDYKAGFDLARKENRPVFIDFTGITCTNCRWMEYNIFPVPEIQSLLNRYIRVQLYTDAYPGAEENQKLQAERFGTVALPFYAILRPDGSVVDTRGGIIRNPKDFAAFLKSGL